jgi:hypothetical protein
MGAKQAAEKVAIRAEKTYLGAEVRCGEAARRIFNRLRPDLKSCPDTKRSFPELEKPILFHS